MDIVLHSHFPGRRSEPFNLISMTFELEFRATHTNPVRGESAPFFDCSDICEYGLNLTLLIHVEGWDRINLSNPTLQVQTNIPDGPKNSRAAAEFQSMSDFTPSMFTSLLASV